MLKNILARFINQPVWVRTVTMTNAGILVEAYEDCLVLDKAVWLANTGLFSKFCKEGVADEVEPMTGPIIMPYTNIIDAGGLPQVPPVPSVPDHQTYRYR